MTTANWVWSSKTWATTTVIFGGILIAASDRTLAQVVPDNTLGSGRSRVTPIDQQNDRIDGGVLRGANLFHSFQDFGVEANRGVQFSNPTGVENIFSRVTGNTPSNIYGTLGVQGNANLFLLNPNGILFGPNARLDLRGSFVASTADSFVFPDGSQFSATNPTAPPLLEINVQAPIGLQFAVEQPGLIVNSGNLQVDPGQNLALAGGTVVSTGELSAPGGDIAVVTVQSNGIAPELMPVLQFSRRGQLLGQTVAPRLNDGSTASATVTSLPEMVTEWGANTGLAISPSGQVELADSGLSVAAGDVAVQQLHAATATLSAANDLTLAASHLETTGNLQLLAQDTVRARDSEATPFVASAGGELLVQGNQGVDIFALNHPSSGLFSGGDMVLRSANTVGGDAHYWSGGNFRIEQLNGTPGSLFSPHDPIVRAAGDVEFDSYNGASLHIFAGGSVRINNITITGPDIISQSIRENVTLSNGEVVPIDGSTQPTLDIRAGTTAFTSTGIVGFIPVSPNTNGTGTSADITIGEIVNNGGTVFLTNLYEPNLALPGGTIQVDSINTSISFNNTSGIVGGSVFLDARSNISLFDSNNERGSFIDTSHYRPNSPSPNNLSEGNAGNITLIAGNAISLVSTRLITTTAVPRSLINDANDQRRLVIEKKGNGGEVRLVAGGGVSFSEEASINSSTAGVGNSGNVTIESGESVSFIDASISSETSGAGNAGNVTIRAPNSTIYFQGELDSDKGESDNAEGIFSQSCRFDDRCNPEQSFGDSVGRNGNVELIANSVYFTNLAEVVSSVQGQGQGDSGYITINATDSVSFTNGARILADTLSSGNAGDITVTAGNSISFDGINGDRNSGAFSRSSLASSPNVPLPQGDGGTIVLSARNISLSNSARISVDAAGSGNGGNITVRDTNSVALSGGAQLDSSTARLGNGGNININTRESIAVSGEGSQIFSGSGTQDGCLDNQCRGGNIALSSNSIELGDSAKVSVATEGSGDSGNIRIQATDSVALSGGAQLNSGTSGSGDGGDITVRANSAISLAGNNSNLLSQSLNTNNSSRLGGNGGNIRLNAGSITVSDRAQISANTQTSGNGGSISIGLPDPQGLRVPETNSVALNSGARLNSGTSGSGNGGNIAIQNAQSFALTGGAITDSSTSGTGNGGTITIRDTNSVALSGGARLNSSTSGSGNGGDITVRDTNSVTISSRAQLDSSTAGLGNGGNININTRESIAVSGEGSQLFSGSGTQAGCLDNQCRGGNIALSSNSIRLADRAEVGVATEGSGDSGNIRIRAIDSVVLSSGAQLNSGTSGSGDGGNIRIRNADSVTVRSGARLNSSTSGSGNGGNIRIRNADSVAVRDGARLNSSTSGSGDGGNIRIRNADSVSITGGAAANSSTLGTGNGGTITINARELIAISDRARINASTSGAGSGGSVFIQDADSVTISDRAQINASTSDAGEDAGDGGSVFIQDADSVNISDRAQVDAATSGTGSGGEVTIQSDTVSIDHAGISVRAEEEGDAGTIRISAGTLTLDNQAEIAATAQISQGGNITLQTDDYVLMRRGSSISAISEGAGSQDGTIDLSDTGVIVTSPLEDNDVLARSERGGDIELNATLGFQIQQGLTQVEGRSDITGTGDISVNLNVDPNRSLTPLPAEPDSPEISNACQVSSDRRTAEFYNVGRGGLRSRPDEPLNPNTVAEDWIPLELAKDNSRSESNQAPVSQPPTSTSRASSPCQSL